MITTLISQHLLLAEPGMHLLLDISSSADSCFWQQVVVVMQIPCTSSQKAKQRRKSQLTAEPPCPLTLQLLLLLLAVGAHCDNSASTASELGSSTYRPCCGYHSQVGLTKCCITKHLPAVQQSSIAVVSPACPANKLSMLTATGVRT